MNALDLLEDQSSTAPVSGIGGSRRRNNRATIPLNNNEEKSNLSSSIPKTAEVKPSSTNIVSNLGGQNTINSSTNGHLASTSESQNASAGGIYDFKNSRRRKPDGPGAQIFDKEQNKDNQAARSFSPIEEDQDAEPAYVPSISKRTNANTGAKLDNILNDLNKQTTNSPYKSNSNIKQVQSREGSVDYNNWSTDKGFVGKDSNAGNFNMVTDTFRGPDIKNPTGPGMSTHFNAFNSTSGNAATSGDDAFKLKLENENLKSKIETLTSMLDQEKKRSNQNYEDDHDKIKKIKQDNESFILDLKKKHKQEIAELEERYKLNLNTINEEKRRMKMDLEQELMAEKERVKLLHDAELENKEALHKKNLEEQKKFYASQNESLNQRLQQQIELNKLATKVESNSKLVEEIIMKFQSDKEKILQSEKYMVDNKEKYLSEQEERLKKLEDVLLADKENLLKMRKDLELNDMQKRTELREERQRIDKELGRLTEMQASLKDMEYNAKERFEKERLELLKKMNDAQTELDNYKSQYKSKINELEYQKRMLCDEKEFFEKYKEEAIKNIETKKISLEDKKKDSLIEEKEFKKRLKIIQEKEYYLKDRYEEYEKIKRDIVDAKKVIDTDKRSLLLAAKRLEEDVKMVHAKNSVIDREKEQIMRRFQEYENDRALLNNEKIKIEQAKSELKLRMQSMDLMRMKFNHTANQFGDDNPLGYMNEHSSSKINNYGQSQTYSHGFQNNNYFNQTQQGFNSNQQAVSGTGHNFRPNTMQDFNPPQQNENRSENVLDNLKSKLENPNQYLFATSKLSETGEDKFSNNKKGKKDFSSYLSNEMENLRKTQMDLNKKQDGAPPLEKQSNLNYAPPKYENKTNDQQSFSQAAPQTSISKEKDKSFSIVDKLGSQNIKTDQIFAPHSKAMKDPSIRLDNADDYNLKTSVQPAVMSSLSDFDDLPITISKAESKNKSMNFNATKNNKQESLKESKGSVHQPEVPTKAVKTKQEIIDDEFDI